MTSRSFWYQRPDESQQRQAGNTRLGHATATVFAQLYHRASPINYISADDPPVFFLYTQVPRGPLPLDAVPAQALHHIRHGEALKEVMDQLGIECVVKDVEDYGVSRIRFGGPDLVGFLKKHLRPSP